MKKIYSLCMFLVAGVGLSAQSVVIPAPSANKTLPTRPVKPGTFDNKKVNHSRTTQSYWMNYGVCMDSSITGPGVAELNQNYLCTDSTLLGNFGGTYAGI